MGNEYIKHEKMDFAQIMPRMQCYPSTEVSSQGAQNENYHVSRSEYLQQTDGKLRRKIE
jgi:hypothetical protein